MKGKRFILLIVLAALILCLGLTAGKPRKAPENTRKATPTLDMQAQVIKAAKTFLAQKLSIGIDEISLVKAEAIIWPDSCLGLAKEDEMCAQMLVRGYKIVLQAQGTIYTLHTNGNGKIVRIES